VHASEAEHQGARAALEIWRTEESYVRGLEAIVRNFLEPLEREKQMSKEKRVKVFGNVEEILRLNRQLLAELEVRAARGQAWSRDRLGALFEEHLARMLGPYQIYCDAYDRANEHLQAMLARRKDLQAFLDRCKREAGLGLPLTALLIYPVQRLPRYRLLLEELLVCPLILSYLVLSSPTRSLTRSAAAHG
jgi:hypothetical protein